MLSFIHQKTDLSLLFLFSVLPALTASTAAADLHRVTECWAAPPLDLNSSQDTLVDRLATSDVFRVEIPSPGVLLPEVFGNVLAFYVELLGDHCKPLRAQDLTYVDRFPGRTAIKINKPGIYHLRVTAARAANWEPYRFRLGFSKPIPILIRQFLLKDIEEWEEDDEGLVESPGPILLLPSDSTTKDIEEWEEDDEGVTVDMGASCLGSSQAAGEAALTVKEPGILAFDGAGSDFTVILERLDVDAVGGRVFGPSHEILAPIEPGLYWLRWMTPDDLEDSCGPRLSFYPVCGLRPGDDYGDSLACRGATSCESLALEMKKAPMSC